MLLCSTWHTCNEKGSQPQCAANVDQAVDIACGFFGDIAVPAVNFRRTSVFSNKTLGGSEWHHGVMQISTRAMTVLPYWFVCVIPSLYDIQISRRSLPWLFWCHSPKYAVVFCLRGRKRSVPFIQFEATNRLKEISCLTFYQVSILIYWLQLLDDWRYTSIFSITYLKLSDFIYHQFITT